jgi:hypothetical protein
MYKWDLQGTLPELTLKDTGADNIFYILEKLAKFKAGLGSGIRFGTGSAIV